MFSVSKHAMRDTVRIDLHGHSTFSDGLRTPETIASECARRNVRFAALTDHNSIDGLDAFESACERHGVGWVNGLELHIQLGYRDVHLLCYGFDRTDPDLRRALTLLKTSRNGHASAYAAIPRPEAGELINVIHHAGGITLMAHPLMTEPDRTKLEDLLDSLFALGMDGLELQHPQTTADDRAFLLRMAQKHSALVSAGTDHHGRQDLQEAPLGVDVDALQWRTLRDAMLHRRRSIETSRPPSDSEIRTATPLVKSVAGRMLVPMVLPALAVIALFTLALFGFFLPNFEDALLERKRETIRELTRTIWSMLDEADRQVQQGTLSLQDAQTEALERVRALRYGRESLDYFWLQDRFPRMIMHPYRPDLEGQDLSDFEDPRGSRIFRLFVDKVDEDGSGYVDYVWQWKDDPERMEAKESYIKLFEPWGWIIGTGLYINDVKAEIRALEWRFYHVMLAISSMVVLLLLYMLRGGLKAERQRRSAEQRMHESNARYASLVKAASEGVLFVRNHRCVYANPVFLQMAGCTADELALMDWQEFFPDMAQGRPLQETSLSEIVSHAATLHRRDGHNLACSVAFKGIPDDQTGSVVILVRRATEAEASIPSSDNSLLKRLLNLPSATAEDFAREIADSGSEEDVVRCCLRVPDLVRSMLDSSAAPTAITAMLTSITDAATVRLIELAQEDLGPSPVDFAFVVVGSQGRHEQTLFTDQDHMLIMGGHEPSKREEWDAYFAALTERVCAWLVKAGYRECKGQLMANNAKWRQSLETWKDRFHHWISKAEGHEAMDFMTLFDMRCVYGDEHLVEALRKHIDAEIEHAPWFFTQAARNAIQFKTPLRLFGTIVTAGRTTEKSGHLDLKAAMMPIVCYARLYALKEQLQTTATLERLGALRDKGVLLPSRYNDILTAMETLMRLRLRHQTERIREAKEPDNQIRLSTLGHIDEAVLKECFQDIDRIQNGIVQEFLGGEAGNS